MEAVSRLSGLGETISGVYALEVVSIYVCPCGEKGSAAGLTWADLRLTLLSEDRGYSAICCAWSGSKTPRQLGICNPSTSSGVLGSISASDAGCTYFLARAHPALDKLVAISTMAKGMAQSLQDPRPEKYLAGLWRQNLESGLLWEMEDQPRPRPVRYRHRPGRASVDGKVRAVTEKYPQLVNVDAATSWDTTAGRFSAVTGVLSSSGAL